VAEFGPKLGKLSARNSFARLWQFIAVASEPRFMLNAVDDVVKKLGLGKQKAEMAKY